MFIFNKYFYWYFEFMTSCVLRGWIKNEHDCLFTHHIIPRSFGGPDSSTNIVCLTYREHRIAHLLLPKFTTGKYKQKMLYAARFFDSSIYVPGPGWTKETHAKGVETRKRQGSYKTGANNIFSSAEIKELVKERMKTNNPMKNPETVKKYKLNRPHSNHVKTPDGYFYSLREAARFYNTTPHLLKGVVERNPTTHKIITPAMRNHSP